jgi:hypothetical protein
MIGLPTTGAIGLGISPVSGKSLVPLPAAKTIAFKDLPFCYVYFCYVYFCYVCTPGAIAPPNSVLTRRSPPVLRD